MPQTWAGSQEVGKSRRGELTTAAQPGGTAGKELRENRRGRRRFSPLAGQCLGGARLEAGLARFIPNLTSGRSIPGTPHISGKLRWRRITDVKNAFNGAVPIPPHAATLPRSSLRLKTRSFQHPRKWRLTRKASKQQRVVPAESWLAGRCRGGGDYGARLSFAQLVQHRPRAAPRASRLRRTAANRRERGSRSVLEPGAKLHRTSQEAYTRAVGALRR